MHRTIFLTLLLASCATAFVSKQPNAFCRRQQQQQQQQQRASRPTLLAAAPTELPDSLDDAAVRAAAASAAFAEQAGPAARCRVDFDTSVGDETFPILKTSSEFMQKFVSALSYALVPGLQEQRQKEITAVAEATAELGALRKQEETDAVKVRDLQQLIANGGRAQDYQYVGPTVRVYFPDEGNAALARRDWNPTGSPDVAKVPACVKLASCGGVQPPLDVLANDCLILFFCPKASESEQVEAILQKMEETAIASGNLKLTVFVNPNLVDMGVTGFGMAGRLLRERLIDTLTYTYTLRTLAWGALTREWPCAYTVWQEDENIETGYRLIKTLDRLPSNPEVEDIYDIENGNMSERESGGVLDALGNFVNGMMSL
jgi:hypothetical protein